jgi:glutamyl-tRNA synthetase
MLNYLALMGWAMPDEREEFTLQELVAELDLERISLGGPVFDLEKLRWLNGKYLRGLSTEDLLVRLRQDLLSDEYLMSILPLVHERIEKLEDFLEYSQFFFVGEVSYDEAARKKLVAKKRTPPQTAKALRVLLEKHIDPMLDWSPEALESALRGFCEEYEWSPKEVFMPVRIAVTGRAATPPLFETMAVLGKEVCRRRLRNAIEVLRTIKE